MEQQYSSSLPGFPVTYTYERSLTSSCYVGLTFKSRVNTWPFPPCTRRSHGLGKPWCRRHPPRLPPWSG
eukprot:5117080-Amphidinium_carterae.1